MFRGKNNKKRRQKQAETVMVNALTRVSPQPPKYDSNAYVSKTFRFFCSAAGFYTITPAKLGALIVVGTVVNTSATLLFDAVKIRKVEIWAGQISVGGASTVSCSWSGSIAGLMGNQRVDSDTSIGADRVAYVCSKPPKLSQAAQWQQTDNSGIGTNTIFQLNLVAGAIVDLHLNLRMTFGTRTSANTVALTTVVLTQLYYLALDNPCGTTGSQSSSIRPDSSLITTT